VVTAPFTTVGGDKPLMSFGSTLSRDPRFTNHRRDGLYYWWLKEVDLPASFRNEAEPDDFAGLLGSASSSSSQEGGESHAATT
jgi:hypothetical protein